MSVLLAGLPEQVEESLVTRLVAQEDEVRILGPASARSDRIRELGAHLALGNPADDDLVERAAQHVRTIVFGPPASVEGWAGLLKGGLRAGVGRWVHVAATPDPEVVTSLRSSEVDYAVLKTGSKGLLRTKSPAPADIAEAIDAADDLAGEVRLEVDLRDADGWRALRLEPRP